MLYLPRIVYAELRGISRPGRWAGSTDVRNVPSWSVYGEISCSTVQQRCTFLLMILLLLCIV